MTFFKRYPNFSVIIACFFWGTYWIPLRFINSNNQDSIWPIFLSFLFLSLFFFSTLIKCLKKITIQHNYFFFIACFFSGIGIALYSESLLRGKITEVIILFYLCPIWGTIFSYFLIGSKLTIKRFLSIFLGLLGLGIIIGFEKGFFFPENISQWMAIFGGMTWALGTTLFHLAKTSTGVEKMTLTIFIIPFILLLLCFFPNGRNFFFTENLFNFNYLYIWILLFSLIWILPSILLTYLSVEILDSGRLNLLLAFEVAIGIFTASLFTLEIIGIREYVGATLVVTAAILDTINIKSNAIISNH